MLTGLLVLHNRKYSHHDIKPENIFLCHPITPEDIAKDRYRGKLWLKLGDFGQSHLEKVDCGDIMRGSFMYRSPEKVEGKRGSFPSDLFSVGVVMYAAPCCMRQRLKVTCCPQVYACNWQPSFRYHASSSSQGHRQPCFYCSQCGKRGQGVWQKRSAAGKVPQALARNTNHQAQIVTRHVQRHTQASRGAFSPCKSQACAPSPLQQATPSDRGSAEELLRKCTKDKVFPTLGLEGEDVHWGHHFGDTDCETAAKSKCVCAHCDIHACI